MVLDRRFWLKSVTAAVAIDTRSPGRSTLPACSLSAVVVGTRAATGYGLRVGGELAASLAEKGWTIASGGAQETADTQQRSPSHASGAAAPGLRLANPPTACTVGEWAAAWAPVRVRRGRCNAGADSARAANPIRPPAQGAHIRSDLRGRRRSAATAADLGGVPERRPSSRRRDHDGVG